MLDGIQLHLIENLQDALEFKRWLGERHENNAIAVDTETTGLDPREPGAAVRLIQFGDTRHGWAVPWLDWRGLALEALDAWDGDVIYHNAMFERRWLETHSDWRYDAGRSWDTMTAAHIIDPLGSGALKQLSRKYVDRRAATGQRELDEGMTANGWTWATVPVNYKPYWLYAGLDTILTARLWDRFRTEVGPGAKYADVMALEMAVMDVVSKMERRGAMVDVDYSMSKQLELLSRADELKVWGKDAHGILITSNVQLGKRLIDLGFEFENFTNTGQPQVDKALLNLLRNPDNGYSETIIDLANSALTVRESTKVANTYFGNFVSKAIDGIIRPTIKTLGARTGRMSISGPALQQLPKRDGLVRSAFIPRSEDNVLVTCDYSQVESRLTAHFAKDDALAEAFRVADATGGDFFVELGKEVYREPDFQKSDKRRGLLKNTMYGKIYGAGVAKMAESAGIPASRMEAVVNALDSRYPGIKQFMQQVESVGIQRQRKEGQGYVVTPLGRRLPCDEGRVYSLVNYLVQSSAADVLKRAMVRLDSSQYGEFMILPVHDEVVFDLPRELAQDALVDVPAIMADDGYNVPLPAEAEGPFNNWGEKYL